MDVFVPLCSLLFWFLSWSFHVVRCRSPCVIFVFPFSCFCMRTRSRQWLHYSFFVIVCRLWSVVFIHPFFYFSCSYYVVHCRFPSVICCPFLVIFLCPFCLLQSCLLPPVFLVLFVLRRKGLFPCLCVLCLVVWSVYVCYVLPFTNINMLVNHRTVVLYCQADFKI